MLDGVPSLMADLADDTRNVLLTLARIWTTVATGEIRSKDEAADGDPWDRAAVRALAERFATEIVAGVSWGA